MTAHPESQLANTVLMVRPARFESNPETASSNRFQGKSTMTPEEQQRLALQQFESLASVLRENGVEVIIIDDTLEPHTPDSIFPNNWVSFHADGRVVLYPMEAVNRRTERRMDVIELLDSELGYHVSEVVDLSGHEDDGHFLEGTGSMVLERMDYDVVAFDAVDRDGVPIYHTNVLMNVGEEFAVVCDISIERDDQRRAVLERLEATGHTVICLDFDQLDAFAGNMLEVRGADGERVVAMSQQAFDSLRRDQVELLSRNGRIATAKIDDTAQHKLIGTCKLLNLPIHEEDVARWLRRKTKS
jgi:hypothetical protein